MNSPEHPQCSGSPSRGLLVFPLWALLSFILLIALSILFEPTVHALLDTEWGGLMVIVLIMTLGSLCLCLALTIWARKIRAALPSPQLAQSTVWRLDGLAVLLAALIAITFFARTDKLIPLCPLLAFLASAWALQLARRVRRSI